MRKEIKNTASSYIANVYAMVLVFICNSLYYKYLGAELYALVALILLISLIINLLDFGLSATLLREVSVFKVGADVNRLKNIMLSMESIFGLILMVVLVAVFIYIEYLPMAWVNLFDIKKINQDCVAILISILTGVRFYSVIYRAGLIGASELFFLNITTSLTNTLRYVAPLMYMMLISTDIQVFLLLNVCVSLGELVLLRKRFYRAVAIKVEYENFGAIDWSFFKDIAKYSLGVGLASLCITIYSSADRVLASKILNVKEFGEYSLLLLVSTSLAGIATPILMAFMPRLVSLVAAGELSVMYKLYKFMTQAITLILSLVVVFLAIYSSEIVYLLSAGMNSGESAKQILIFHTLGSLCFILNSYQYYLQNALGKYRMHLLGSVIYLILYAPILYFSITQDGAFGAARVWFLFNLFWFLVWSIPVHLWIDKRIFVKWFLFQIMPVFIYSGAVFVILYSVIKVDVAGGTSQLYGGVMLYLLCLLGGLMMVGEIKSYFFSRMKRWRIS